MRFRHRTKDCSCETMPSKSAFSCFRSFIGPIFKARFESTVVERWINGNFPFWINGNFRF
jgi:hypothetical protein